MVEGLFRAHVEAVGDRNLVVLVDKVIAVDVVEGHGSGGIDCSHSEKFDSLYNGREERKTQVGWDDLKSEISLDYLSMGRTMLLPARARQSGRLWMDQIACNAG
jgi:hypothetical protein